MTNSLVQTAIETSSNVTAKDAQIQSTAKLSNGRFSAWTMDFDLCVIWSGNLNRIEWGDIESFAAFIVEFGVPGILEGFVKDGLLHVTDGARRLTAIRYAIDNLGYSPELIKYTAVENDEFKLLARQINSESLVKSFSEKMVIIEKMQSLTKEAGSRYTLAEIAKACNMSVASISNIATVNNKADDETKEAIASGEISGYDVVEAIREKKKAVKKVAANKVTAPSTTKEETTINPVVETTIEPMEETTIAQDVAVNRSAKSIKADNLKTFLSLAEKALSSEVEEVNGNVSIEMDKSQYEALMTALADYQATR